MKMNPFNRVQTMSVIVFGAALLLAGCSTTSGYKQADKTGAGIAEYRAEVVNLKLAVDETLRSMNQIELSANTNPRKAFEKFSRNLAGLDSAAAKADKRGLDMKAQGQAYFDQWELQLAQVRNPEIKQLAEQRKTRLHDAFDGIKKTAEPLKAQFDPWLSDLKDLRNYLNNDLTVAGVDAAKNMFAEAKTDGADVERSIDALVVELNSIAAAITPARTTAPPRK
jgi:hypothetical protein